MRKGVAALRTAQRVAAVLTRIVDEALESADELQLKVEINLPQEAGLSPYGACLWPSDSKCGPHPSSGPVKVPLSELTQALRTSADLLQLVELGLDGPSVPESVIKRIRRITEPPTQKTPPTRKAARRVK
jgi:hypothetical protein